MELLHEATQDLAYQRRLALIAQERGRNPNCWVLAIVCTVFFSRDVKSINAGGQQNTMFIIMNAGVSVEGLFVCMHLYFLLKLMLPASVATWSG